MSGARQRPSRPAQRWPDIMIGAVTLALLAGFGALMLGERQRPVVAQTPPPASPVIPASPGTVPEPQPVQATPPAAQPATATPAEPATTTTTATPGAPASNTPATPAAGSTPATPATASTAAATTTTSSGVAQTSEIPPVPKAPPVEPIKPPVVTQPPAQQAPAPTEQPAQAQQPATTTPAPATTAAPPRASGAVATSASRVPLRSDYRISLGSFTTRKTVESQTANVRGLGYTVHAIDLGDQYVAQIGPFADEATARQALADIQRAYPGALLYRPRNAAQNTDSTSTATANSTTASSAATPSSTPASSSEPQAPTQTAPARQASAPSGPTYIQVGAFDRAESAQNLVGVLKDNGFAPTVNSPEGKLTTVLVGPYSGDAVLRAEARLDNAGLQHFRVR